MDVTFCAQIEALQSFESHSNTHEQLTLCLPRKQVSRAAAILVLYAVLICRGLCSDVIIIKIYTL